MKTLSAGSRLGPYEILASALESFAFSPDGEGMIVSMAQDRSDLVLVDGLTGIER